MEKRLYNLFFPQIWKMERISNKITKIKFDGNLVRWFIYDSVIWIHNPGYMYVSHFCPTLLHIHNYPPPPAETE